MPDAAARVDRDDLSIVTLTYNNFTDRGTTLPVLLAALERQTLPAGTELVVVDDGSSDRTPEYVRRRAREIDDLEVRLVRTEHTGNQCENRNAGIEAATGDLLVFLDDDTVPLGDDALRRAIECYEPGHFLCGARRYWSPPEWDAERVLRAVKRGATDDLREWAHLPTGSIKRRTGSRSLQEYTFIENFGVVAKADVERVGGLDEDYEEWGHGDTDLMLRLLLDGVDFVNVHDALEVVHLNTPLGFRRGAANTNSDVFHEKLDALGVDFDVARLYDAPAGEHPDVVMAQDGVDDASLAEATVRIRRPGPTDRPGGRVGAEIPPCVGDGDHAHAHEDVDDREHDRECDGAVSVIVPTYDSFRGKDGTLAVVLRALEQQRGPEIELVVVDDASSDRTGEFLAEFVDRTALRTEVIELPTHTGNRSLARNRGAEAATNDVLAFLDDDTIPLSTTTLASALARYEPGRFLCGARKYWNSAYEDLAVVEGAVERRDYRALARRAVLPRGISRPEGYRSLRGYAFLGSFGVVDAEEFADVGGFDEKRMDGWGAESEDLMYRLDRNGATFESLREHAAVLHVNHPVRDADFEAGRAQTEAARARRRADGDRFEPHHLFGGFENDGTALLGPTDE